MHSSQKHLEPGPVNARLQGVQSAGLRSLTRQAGGDSAGRFRCGTETECNRSSRPVQRRETDSQRHSTGEAGRQMLVFGERERGELPSPIFSTGSGLAGRTNQRSNSKNWPAGICRRAFSRTNLGMGSLTSTIAGGFSACSGRMEQPRGNNPEVGHFGQPTSSRSIVACSCGGEIIVLWEFHSPRGRLFPNDPAKPWRKVIPFGAV